MDGKAIKIAFTNQKGGVGKTTSATCMASDLTEKGYKVLVIDTDPQRNTTRLFRAQTEDEYTLADVLYDKASIKKAIQHTEMGDVVAADLVLKYADTKIPSDADRLYHLYEAIEEIDNDYDYIIIDTPRGNGVLLDNVLTCSDYVIVPTELSPFAIEGLADVDMTIKEYKKRINPNLSILGLLIVKSKKNNLQKNLEENVLEKAAEAMNTQIFSTKIRECVMVGKSQLARQSLYDFAPKCTTAEDYHSFTDEALELLKQK